MGCVTAPFYSVLVGKYLLSRVPYLTLARPPLSLGFAREVRLGSQEQAVPLHRFKPALWYVFSLVVVP